MAGKVKRDAFLYLDPVAPKGTFAQCGTCSLYVGADKRCSILGDTEVLPTDSCGFYVPGKPSAGLKVRALVSPSDAGLVHREVRCENCEFFKPKKSRCGLFVMLNREMPDTFDLVIAVDKQGCCNANTAAPKEAEPATRRYGKGE